MARPDQRAADYAVIGDCHSVALVSRGGSIDWCCLPRFDEGSTFGRLLDSERGGHCTVAPVDETPAASRRYLDGTLVLETTFRCEDGEAAVLDCFLMPPADDRDERRRILRVIEGRRGRCGSRCGSPRVSTTGRSNRGCGVTDTGCTAQRAATIA